MRGLDSNLRTRNTRNSVASRLPFWQQLSIPIIAYIFMVAAKDEQTSELGGCNFI